MLLRYKYKNLGIIYEIPDLYGIALTALLEIPPEKVTTYKELAIALGDPIAARAVGYIMKTNPYPDLFPCYKVVSSDGTLGGYSKGINEKISRLIADGVTIKNNRVDLQKHLFSAEKFKLNEPLKALQHLQIYFSRKVVLRDSLERVKFLSAFDLSFIEGPPDLSIGTAVLFDMNENLLGLGISIVPVQMPYIPSYLAFRELPAILGILDSLKAKSLSPDMLILDGQGILHPRGLGIASHAGVITGIASIGVAKSLLVGRIESFKEFNSKLKVAPIRYNGETLGYALKRGKHTIYISPGHKISVDSALRVISQLSWPKNLAEPLMIRLPHIIVTRIRRRIKSEIKKFRSTNNKQTGKNKQAKLEDFF